MLRRWILAWAVLGALVLAASLAQADAPEPRFALSETELPLDSGKGLTGVNAGPAAMAWTGEALYVLGHGPNATAITRYDVGEDEARRLDVELPGPRADAVAVWSGEAIYVVGGIQGWERSGDVSYRKGAEGMVRVDPGKPAVEPVDVELPVDPKHVRSATFVGGGDAVYQVGFLAGERNGSVKRWAPGESAFETLGVELPYAFGSAGAAWTDGALLVAGGTGTFADREGSRNIDDVLSYDHETGNVSVLENALPWVSRSLGELAMAPTPEGAVILPGGHRDTEAFRVDAAASTIEPLAGRQPGLPPLEAFVDGETIHAVVAPNRCLGHGGRVLAWNPQANLSPGPTQPPLASFDVPENPGNARVLPNPCPSRDPDGFIVAWAWDWDDGRTSSDVRPLHRYRSPGTYDVTLTVTDDQGASDSVTETIHLEDGPPTTGANLHVVEGLTVRGDGTATHEVFGRIEQYRWDWGDGNVSATEDAKHTYAAEACYVVAFTATDDDGETVTKTWSIEPPDGFARPREDPADAREDCRPEHRPGADDGRPKGTSNGSDRSNDSDGRPTPAPGTLELLALLSGIASASRIARHR